MRTLAIPLLLLATCQDPASATGADDPVQVFAGLDGSWRGTFVGWDAAGTEQYRIAVRQIYETIDANTQTVTIVDTMADGTVITGKGRNTAHRSPEGTLVLSCIVDKSNGDRVEHRGVLGSGPNGETLILWSSAVPDRRETFREWIAGDGKSYQIHGMGTYGGKPMLMAGHYHRAR